MSFDNAISALQAPETSKPDLILTDYQMPAMDGVQFIEKVRAAGQFNDIPIIIITALEDREALYNALEAGATDFLVKPVDIHECQVRCPKPADHAAAKADHQQPCPVSGAKSQGGH